MLAAPMLVLLIYITSMWECVDAGGVPEGVEHCGREFLRQLRFHRWQSRSFFESSCGTGVNTGHVAGQCWLPQCWYCLSTLLQCGSVWMQEAYLKVSNTAGGSFFGSPVSVAGSRALSLSPRVVLV